MGVEGVGGGGGEERHAALCCLVRSMARCTCGGMRWKYSRSSCECSVDRAAYEAR